MSLIDPTLDDAGVMDFVSRGYVQLDGAVADEFNQGCAALPGGGLRDFSCTPRFRRELLLHPQVTGVARSVLGEDFLVADSAHHHLFEEPHVGQTWHSDGISERGHGIHHLQCYYYPQDVGPADGPTMVLPGSHHRLIDREAIAHYGDILGQRSLTVPAGTVVLTHYGIWHKAGPKLSRTRRSMIKFSYFRTAAPVRDWRNASGEPPPFDHGDEARPPYAGEVEFYRDMSRRLRMWHWLCGIDPPGDPARGAKLFVAASPLRDVVAAAAAAAPAGGNR